MSILDRYRLPLSSSLASLELGIYNSEFLAVTNTLGILFTGACLQVSKKESQANHNQQQTSHLTAEAGWSAMIFIPAAVLHAPQLLGQLTSELLTCIIP